MSYRVSSSVYFGIPSQSAGVCVSCFIVLTAFTPCCRFPCAILSSNVCVSVCVCVTSAMTGADDLSTVVEDTEACYICFDPVSEQGRELMASPCQCKKPVHRACLSKWIATKGSRLCSICKGKLPIDFTVDAPFVVLQVCARALRAHSTSPVMCQ